MSRLAVVSFVLGVLGPFSLGATAVAGLLVGLVALQRIRASKGALRGQGLSLAGVIVPVVFFAVTFFLALSAAKSYARTMTCTNHLKNLAVGILVYSQHSRRDQLPSAADWCDAIRQYVRSEESYRCPDGSRRLRCHYGLNARLGGITSGKIQSPEQTVLLFETDGGWSVSGGPELLLRQPRHGHAMRVAFADGRVEEVPMTRLQTLCWDP